MTTVRSTRSLRRRTLRAVGWLVLGMGVLVLVPLGLLLTHSFRQLEEREALQHHARAHNALQDQVSELGRVARDYGTWDATWAYLGQQGPPEYLTDNYADATFAQNAFSLVIIADNTRIVFAKAFDLEAGREVAVPREVLENPKLFVELHDRDGLVSLADGLMLVGVSPVVPSTTEGAMRGHFIIGRWLNAGHVARLGRTTRLNLAVGPVEEGLVSGAPRIEPLDDDRLEVHGALLDVHGTPVGRLTAQLERSIWAEGRLAVGLLLVAMAVIALGLLGALRWLLHRLVLRRLDALARDVRRIRDEHDPTLRVADQGSDELGLLGLAINEMLDSLRRLNRQLLLEQDKSEQLLLNVLPRPIAERLKQSNLTIADSFADVSVLFADLTDFTRYSAHVSPVELVNLLDDLFTRFDALAEQHGLEKIKTIGDSYLVVGGLPDPAPDHVFAIAAMALDMRAALAQFNEVHQTSFQLRIGIHCGPVVAGVIGRRKFIYDIWGDTVNTASRLESNGVAAAIQISAQLAHRISPTFEVSHRGTIELKGKGPVEAWWLLGRRDVSVG